MPSLTARSDSHVKISSILVGLATRYYFLSEGCCLVSVGRPLWREDGSAICSVITQWCESRRTRTILYCLIWDSPNLEGQVPVFIPPRNRVAQLYPRALGLLALTVCPPVKCVENKILLFLQGNVLCVSWNFSDRCWENSLRDVVSYNDAGLGDLVAHDGTIRESSFSNLCWRGKGEQKIPPPPPFKVKSCTLFSSIVSGRVE
jgi:hypothetical protein